MAIVVFEKWKSRAGKASVVDPSISIVYGVKGTLDETEVDAAITSASPTTWNGLTRQSWQRECFGPTDDGALWEVTVLYDRNDPRGAGTAHLSADLTAGRVKITQSRETIATFGDIFESDGTLRSASTAPDFAGAIGVTDTSIEGVEVFTPKLELTLQCIVAAGTLDQSYIDTLDAAAGTVNDFRFVINYKGQTITSERRELLFLAGPVSYRGNGDWEFNLKFIRERTVNDLKIGALDNGYINVVEKKGQDYLWINYKEKKDPTSGALVRIPKGVYVERVYEEADFSTLFGPLNIEANIEAGL
jgi:hypothetical protein